MLSVMGGKWGGRRLHAPSSDRLRPTAGRVKQAIFSIIESYRMKCGHAAGLNGVACLDLFAGVGGLGIEAMSRGAECAVFVEKDRRHLESLRRNLEELQAEARVVSSAVEQGDLWQGAGPFDLVFCDPPYALGVEDAVLGMLASPGVLSPGALVVMEHDPSKRIAAPGGFAIQSERKLGPAGLTVLVHRP